MPRVELTGVVSPNRAQQLADYAIDQGIGPCRAYGSVKELCDACDVVAILKNGKLFAGLNSHLIAKSGTEFGELLVDVVDVSVTHEGYGLLGHVAVFS